MIIYSKRLREILISKGYKESKEPEINIDNPKFKVWFFHSSPEINEEIKKYREEYANKSKSS